MALSLVVLLGGLPLAVQAADPPADSASAWTTRTTPAPKQPPAGDSALSLRIYGNDDRLPYRAPARRPDDPAYAVDVTAVMKRCADGSLIITALVIGGQVTPLENSCTSGNGNDGKPAPPVCDPNRWSCAPATAP